MSRSLITGTCDNRTDLDWARTDLDWGHAPFLAFMGTSLVFLNLRIYFTLLGKKSVPLSITENIYSTLFCSVMNLRKIFALNMDPYLNGTLYSTETSAKRVHKFYP